MTLPPDRGHVTTEHRHHAGELDACTTSELVTLIIGDQQTALEAAASAQEAIARFVEDLTPRIADGGRLFYLGAGTSGRLGVLDAAECPPTFCSDPEMVQGVLAGGAPALLRSSEGLEDLEQSAHADLDQRGFDHRDCLVGIAAGGTTPYVRGGLTHARALGALAIAMACVPSDQAPLPCDIDIRLLTGPELLTGSTRLKAGTATKMALNILSTAVMVKLGKVYGNRMIDVAATNSKLVDRSVRILGDLAGVERDRARQLLQSAGGSVKRALLMSAADLSSDDAIKLLDRHGQQLRAALKASGSELSQG